MKRIRGQERYGHEYILVNSYETENINMATQGKRHSGAKKRFKKLKSGLIKAFHQGRRKLLSKKTRNRKRHLRKPFYLAPGDRARVSLVL
jgi:large subunit ribosomal protein L35